MKQDVYIYKTDAMRRLVYLVSHGYTRHTSGMVSPAKAEGLALKFSDRYGIERTSQQRFRSKAKGQANAFLVLWAESKETVRWWLLATPGEGLVSQLEELKDVTDKRSRITLTGYELVQMPRKGRLADWTWRMTPDNREAWQERLKTAVRSGNDELMRQALHSLKRVPAFAESRREAFSLLRLAEAEWQRVQSGEWPYGKAYIGWFGRFQKGDTLPLDTFSKRRTQYDGQ